MNNDKELTNDMLEAIRNYKAMMGIYLATTDISTHDEIINLRQIREVAKFVAELIDFYI